MSRLVILCRLYKW